MIRREVCTYDKAIEIIRYIQDTAKKFDFSVYEEQYGQKLSDQQKYLIIKNLYSLYMQNKAYQESVTQENSDFTALSEAPTAEELQVFKNSIDIEQLQEKLGANVLGITRLVSNGAKGKASTAIVTLLKNLGLNVSGYAAQTSAVEDESGAQRLTREQQLEIARQIKEGANQFAKLGYQMTREFFIAQSRNIDSLKNEDGTVNGIMVFFTQNKEWQANPEKNPAMKYAIDSGITVLVNPTSALIRSTIYSLNNSENGAKINTIYIESDSASRQPNSTDNRRLERNLTTMFDALFRPYTQEDSLRVASNAEKFMNFDFNESTRHQNLAKVFSPIDRLEMTKVVANTFSNYLTKYVQEKIKQLEQQRIDYGDFKSLIGTILNKDTFNKSEQELYDDEQFLETLKGEKGRIEFLKKYKPYEIFEKMRRQWQTWMNMTEEKQMEAMRREVPLKNVTTKDIRDMVQKRNAMFTIALQRDEASGVDNFAALCEEAATFISSREHIRLDFDMNAQRENTTEDTAYDQDEYGVIQIDDINSLESKEKQPKDGWMVNFRETSSFDSLSRITRNMIDNVPLLDRNGNPRFYAGFPQFLDSNYVHALLIDKLHEIYDDEDVIPTLQKSSKQYPWLTGIIRKLDFDNMQQRPNESEQQFNERKKRSMIAFSAFVHDMNKYFTPFWIQKKTLGPTDTEIYETIPVNRPEGTNYLFDSWRASYESGEQLVSDSTQIKSVYDKDANLVKANAKFNNDSDENNYSLTKLKNLYTSAYRQGDKEKQLQCIDQLIQHMRSVGINTASNILQSALSTYNNVTSAFEQLSVIYQGIDKLNDDQLIQTDLLNHFGGAYQNIAKLINDFDENAVESSVRQGSKQYYSHSVPSYLGNFMKKIQNLQPDKEVPKEWIEEYDEMSDDFKRFFEKPKDYYHYFLFHEFGRYDWFYRISRDSQGRAVGGRWMSDWIKDLYESTDKATKEIKHKVMLSFDGLEYSEWDPLKHAILLFNEFNSEKVEKNKQAYSYYHITTLSDANSAEFIRFKRFVSGQVKKANLQGYYTYQELIKERLHDVVLQEYNRIQLVKKRKEAFESGKLDKKKKIQYYDDFVKSINETTGSRGMQFNFIPYLNTYTVTENNRQIKFIDKLSELASQEHKEDEIRALIDTALDNMMNEEFEKAMQEWDTIKLFELDRTYHARHLNIHDSRMLDKISQAINLINENGIQLSQEGINAINELLKAINSIRALAKREQYKSLVYKDNTLQSLKNAFERATHDDRGNLIVDQKIYNDILKLLNTRDEIREQMREYFWNSTFAESQIIEMFTTDLAYYKGPEDFVKRIKEIHAPNSNLNINAKYISSVRPDADINVGKSFERVVYVNDEKVHSLIQHELDEALQNRKRKGLIDDVSIDFIKSNYKKLITVTDGQAMRSFSSYRRIRIMAGDWTDAQERAYWNIKDGKWNMNDFMVVYQTVKPYMFTQMAADSGFVESPYIKSAVQHKNSEFMLAAMFDIISNELGKSSKLKALNTFMEESGIEVVQFASCVKVGLQGAIDFDDNVIKRESLVSERDMVEYLKKQCFIDSDYSNPNITVIHDISYRDWGIQQATPEHLIDHVLLVGTQIRKLVRQDMDDNALIEWDGLKLTKKQWTYLFDAINTENIIQAFQQLSPQFSKIENVQKLLLDEMKGNPRYTLDDQDSIRIENGQFILPICDPAKANKIQALINSILRKRVTEQKINGGSAIQVTAYGGSDDLQIRWKDQDGNLIFNEKEFNGQSKVSKQQKTLLDSIRKQYGSYEAYRKEHKAISQAYVECYMPATSMAMFKNALKKTENGVILDIDSIDDDMRKAIGYRIPTENKYSMLPLYIKGFMPQQNGSTIMLPNDWITMSGSDFDVDKTYLMLQSPESRENFVKARYELTDEINEAVRGKVNFASENSMTNEEFEKTISQLKRMTKQQRDNVMIDLMFGVLTNETSITSQMRPGNYNTLSREAKVFDILENVPVNELMKILREKTGKSNNDIREQLFDAIQRLSDDEIDDLANKYKRVNNLLSPISLLYFHNQNMAGFTLVGIYANGTSHHALMQEQGLMLNNDINITLNGRRARTFDNVRDFYGNLISTNLAEPQAASVDNIKDPVLARLNQNEFTANIMPTLLRLGYSLHDINLFLKQPAIVEITKRYLRGDGPVEVIIDDVRDEYSQKNDEAMHGPGTRTDYEQQFTNNFLAKQILLSRSVKLQEDLSHLTPDYEYFQDIMDFAKNQMAVIDMFRRIYNVTSAMTNFVQTTRSDTQSGGAGPLIADTESKIYKWENIIGDENFPITVQDGSLAQFQRTNMLKDYNKLHDDNDKIRFNMYNSKISFLQAFYTFGLEGSRYLFSKYFPLLQSPFILIVKQMQQLTKYTIDADTLNDIYNSFFDYAATSTGFFGSSEDMSALKKREYFIKSFANDFNALVQAKDKNGNPLHPDLANNEFIKRLKVNFVDKAKIRVGGVEEYKNVKVISFRNVGLLTAFQKDKYMRAWEDMLYSDDPVVRRVAINLFRYSFYRHGFKFGPTSFMHLCPAAIKTACPEYVQLLRNITDSEWIKNHLVEMDLLENMNKLLIYDMYKDYTPDGQTLYSGNFADQYIRNNITNYKFVVQNIIPKLKKSNVQAMNLSSIQFISGNDQINDVVQFTILNPNKITNQDKRLIKHTYYDDSGNIMGYDLMPYFSVRLYGELVYYKADNPSMVAQTTYHRVYPLGYPNQFIEYDQGSSPSQMESVFWFQNELGIKFVREQHQFNSQIRLQNDADISKGDPLQRNVYDEIMSGQWQNDHVQQQHQSNDAYQQIVPSQTRSVTEQQLMESGFLSGFDNSDDSEEMKQLYETTLPIFVEDSSNNYRNRTMKNAKADATIAFAIDFDSAGERLTKNSVLQLGKKYIPVDTNDSTITEELVNRIVNELNSVNARTLNIAGNGIYTLKGKYTQLQVDEYVYELLNRVLNHPNLITKIENIRSGGLTGYDEAGIKAAMRLGIENGILAPKGWKFRNINGVDISDEQAFKARFNIGSTQLSGQSNPNIAELKENEDYAVQHNICKKIQVKK